MWEDESDVFCPDVPQTMARCLPTFGNESPESSKAASLLHWLVIFLFSLQARYHISDAAPDVLFVNFFSVLGRFSPFLTCFVKDFPKSTSFAHRYLGTKAEFIQYELCPKCFSLYSFENCKEKVGSRELSKQCTFVPYPRHPQISRRSPCNAFLLKSFETPSGQALYPYETYCYKLLTTAIQVFASSRLECKNWCNRVSSDILRDIYDGQMWKSFQNISGSPFLAAVFLCSCFKHRLVPAICPYCSICGSNISCLHVYSSSSQV